MSVQVVGVDIAKRVFQLHWVDKGTGEVVSKQIRRAKFLEHFANRPACLVGMEACGGAQHWARELRKLGHEVKMMSAKFVKAFVPGNKTDAADAQAIWLAAQQACVRAVAIKSEEQQAILSLHRMRSQLVRFRTAQINCVRSLLGEYGEVMAVSRKTFQREIGSVLTKIAERLPRLLLDTLLEQVQRIRSLDEQISGIADRLEQWHEQNVDSVRVAKIPGVGVLTATAVLSVMGEAGAFRSGREFSAFLGLVPRQSGTGGRVRLLGISKRGDRYIRQLLIHGARTVLTRGRYPSEWTVNIRQRRPTNVAVVALANKTARTIWALVAHGREYDHSHCAQMI
jgi:transposase